MTDNKKELAVETLRAFKLIRKELLIHVEEIEIIRINYKDGTKDAKTLDKLHAKSKKMINKCNRRIVDLQREIRCNQ